MFTKFFETYPAYEIIEKPSGATIEQYRGILPNEILSLWENYGWGIFMDGYLRLVDPGKFQAFADEYIENIGFAYVPVAVSAFGDLLVWKIKKQGYLEFYDFRHSNFKTLSTSTGLGILFNMNFVDNSFIWE